MPRLLRCMRPQLNGRLTRSDAMQPRQRRPIQCIPMGYAYAPSLAVHACMQCSLKPAVPRAANPCARCVAAALQGWSLLSIFVSTILGLVLDPLPVGAWAFIAVTAAIATQTLTFAQAFSATTNEIIWLIVVSFFFAKVGPLGGGAGGPCVCGRDRWRRPPPRLGAWEAHGRGRPHGGGGGLHASFGT